MDNYPEDALIDSVEALMELGAFYHEILLSLMDYEWMSDSVTEAEAMAVLMILHLGHGDKFAGRQVVDMPFLSDVEPADVAALNSLRGMSTFMESEFDQVMAHPSISKGITDDLAPVVAMLYGVAMTNPELLDNLLDPEGVNMERRAIELPHSGRIDLGIVRTGAGSPRSMDLLEHAVRTSESLMGEPLTNNYVGLLFEDAVSSGAAGTHFSGTHLTILAKYDVDDDSYAANFAGHIIAHEVAHYYWKGNSDWVDEGAADFMASTIEHERTGDPLGASNPPCPYYQTISQQTSIPRQPGTPAFSCNYSIGERFFLDMYRSLGSEAFWPGMRKLYQASGTYEHSGASLTIDEAREAFGSEAPAVTIISRWYDGMEPYDLSRLDTGPVDPSLPDINGRIDNAYITLGEDESSVSTFSNGDVTDYVWLELEYSYNVTGAPRETTLEIVEFYEDGFEFRRGQLAITAESAYIGGTSWHFISSKPLARGRYWVYVYDGDRKVAEAQFEVTP